MTDQAHRQQERTAIALLRKPQEQTKDTVLLVDDDAEIRKTVSDMLTRSGYSVLTAVDGGSALQVLKGGIVIDLVIADYQMPEMDGLTLVRRIKEKMPDMPVVILTGHGNLESYLCATGLGVIRYIGKPIGMRELLKTVRDAVADGLCHKVFAEARAEQTQNDGSNAAVRNARE